MNVCAERIVRRFLLYTQASRPPFLKTCVCLLRGHLLAGIANVRCIFATYRQRTSSTTTHLTHPSSVARQHETGIGSVRDRSSVVEWSGHPAAGQLLAALRSVADNMHKEFYGSFGFSSYCSEHISPYYRRGVCVHIVKWYVENIDMPQYTNTSSLRHRHNSLASACVCVWRVRILQMLVIIHEHCSRPIFVRNKDGGTVAAIVVQCSSGANESK